MLPYLTSTVNASPQQSPLPDVKIMPSYIPLPKKSDNALLGRHGQFPTCLDPTLASEATERAVQRRSQTASLTGLLDVDNQIDAILGSLRGSVLAPLFVLFMVTLSKIIERSGLELHQLANKNLRSQYITLQ